MRKLALALALALSTPALAVVPSTSSYVDATGNGATTVFAFTFPVTTASTDVQVLLAGVVQSSGYTVFLNANQTSSPGGTVTFTVAPPSAAPVRIQRTVALTQATSLPAYGAYSAKTVEKMADRLTYGLQQVDRVAQQMDPMQGRVFLNADVTQVDGGTYTTIFTIPMTMVVGQPQHVRVHLWQQTDDILVGVQNGAKITGANLTGTCIFRTLLTASSEGLLMMAIGTSDSDTGASSGLDTTFMYDTIDCFLFPSNTTPTNLIVQFQAETAGMVTTYRGSWYEIVVDD